MMQKIKTAVVTLFLLLTQFVVVAHAQAQQFGDPPKLENFGDMIIDIINNALFPFAAIIGVGFVVRAGYTWMAANGDPAKIAEAQGTITWAIIGLIFLFLIRFILGIILDFFGINSF